jgi:translocator protein
MAPHRLKACLPFDFAHGPERKSRGGRQHCATVRARLAGGPGQHDRTPEEQTAAQKRSVFDSVPAGGAHGQRKHRGNAPSNSNEHYDAAGSDGMREPVAQGFGPGQSRGSKRLIWAPLPLPREPTSANQKGRSPQQKWRGDAIRQERLVEHSRRQVISYRPLRGILSLPVHNAWAWALAACIAAAALEGMMSGRGVQRRFAELRLPKFGPRLWAWPILGAAYYVLFFFLTRSLLDRPATPYWTPVALALTAALLLANAGWNWIFFRRKDLRLSFLFFAPYLLLALALAPVLFRVRSPVSRWYLFYLAYLGYAAWWGYSVWRLNRDSSQIG